MRCKLPRLVAVTLALLTGGACGDDAPSGRSGNTELDARVRAGEEQTSRFGPGVPALPSSPSTTPPVSPFEAGNATQLIDGLRRAFKVEQLRVREVVLYAEGYVIVEAQDPANPEHLDRYVYRGGSLEAPSPLRGTQTEFAPELFGLSEPDWSMLPALAAEALRQIPTEAGEITHVIADRSEFDEGQVVLRVYVNGPRGGGYLKAAADGTVLRVYA
jgi:hypothetical protein